MKERNYGLDLYRILCMFLITTIHIFGYSNITEAVPYTHLNFYFINFIKVLQTFSISGFVLISAYFLVSDKISVKTSVKKIVSFELLTLFYSILILLLSLIFITTNVSKMNLLKSFFPTITNHYWYPVNYIFLLVVSPFLNKFVYALSKKQLKAIVLIIFVGFAFLTINPFFDADVYVGHYSHGFIWFICLYFIAAYIKLYGITIKNKFVFIAFAISGIVMFALYLYRNNIFNLREEYKFIYDIIQKLELLSYNSILPLIFTISSFVLFSRIKFKIPQKGVKIWNYIVSSAYVVYLIQEHNVVRDSLWSFVNIKSWATSPYLIFITIAVFMVLLAIAMILHLCFCGANKLYLNKLGKAKENLFVKILDKPFFQND